MAVWRTRCSSREWAKEFDLLIGVDQQVGIASVETGGEPFEVFDPPTGGDRVRTGARGRVGHGGILRGRNGCHLR
jgi:hypothetical protein